VLPIGSSPLREKWIQKKENCSAAIIFESDSEALAKACMKPGLRTGNPCNQPQSQNNQ
jgi:hypothetical protein